MEEDRSKLIDVYKELKDPDLQKLLEVVIYKYDAGEYHQQSKTAKTAAAITPQSIFKNKPLFATALVMFWCFWYYLLLSLLVRLIQFIMGVSPPEKWTLFGI